MQKAPVRHQHSSRGMTLVEIMVVLVILSVVMMAVMSLYIPAVQSTNVQTQLSDVQGGMRLAMNRITQDILTAGFLVDPFFDPDETDDEKPGPIYWEIDPWDETVTNEMTIRTRLVGNGFARVPDGGDTVAVESGADFKMVLSDPDMVEMFPGGSKVRLYEPISTQECDQPGMALTVPQPDETKRVYTVIANSGGALHIDDPHDKLAVTDVRNETVVVRVKDNSQYALQTIRYRVENGALVRTVTEHQNRDDGNDTIEHKQILARNIDSASFVCEFSPNDLVKKVNVTLIGKTGEAGGGAVASAKTRTLETSVTLRNVF